MLIISIDKQDIKSKVLLHTALKARFMQGKELNTFKDEAESGILPTAMDGIIIVGSHTSLTYDISTLKAEILMLAEQKARVLKIANLADITIGEDTIITKNYTIPKSTIFTNIQEFTEKLAFNLESESIPAETFILDANDETYFNKLYSLALNELCVEDVMFKTDTQVAYKGSFKSDSVNDIEKQIQNNIDAYLQNRIISLFYAPLLVERKENDTDALSSLQIIKRYLTNKADVSILSQIIEEGKNELQASLYPLSRKLPTGIYVTQEESNSIIFNIESGIITSAALQLIRNIGKDVLVNAALSKWYVMCGITPDANDSIRLLNTAKETIISITDDRIRLDGMFDRIFTDSFSEILHVIHRFPERGVFNALSISGNSQIEELTLTSFPGIVNSTEGAWNITLGGHIFTINLIPNDPEWYQKIVTALEGSDWIVSMYDYSTYKLRFQSKSNKWYSAPSFTPTGTGITGTITTITTGQEPTSTPSISLTRCQVAQPPQTIADILFTDELERLFPQFVYLYIVEEWFRISDNNEYQNTLEKLQKVIDDIQHIFVRRLQTLGRL